jgi:uncharacterized protein with PIN domain
MRTDIDSEVRVWAEKAAIGELIARYADAVTRADWDQLEGVFAPDAVLEVGPPFDFRAETPAGIRAQISEGSRLVEFLVQMVHSSVVRIEGDERGRATTTIHEFGRGIAGGLNRTGDEARVNFEFFGVYYDDVVKFDGEWKFLHRVCRPLYVENDGLDGKAFAERNTLLRAP